MRQLILILVISALTAQISMAGDFQDRTGFVSGAELYDFCNNEVGDPKYFFCQGYVAGSNDALWEITYQLFPKMEGVTCDNLTLNYTVGELIDTVQWVFRNYPEASLPSSDAEIVVGRALWHLWRCEGTLPKEWS